jgi:hypothetical protein
VTARVEASISGDVMPAATYPTLANAMDALRQVADVEAWLPAWHSTMRALAPAAEPGIRAVLERDGRWTAPLQVGHRAHETEMLIRWA